MIFNYVDLLGVPYRYGGRDQTGLDCWGLCIEIYKRLGIDLPDVLSPAEGTHEEIVTGIRQHSDLVSRIDQPEPFCIALFHIHSRDFADHIGIVLEDTRRFVHIYDGMNVHLVRLDHPFWSKRIIGFYRWKTFRSKK